MKAAKKRGRAKLSKVIHDYDSVDTSAMIDPSKPLKYGDIGLRLPEAPPTQVISIRLPSSLLNKLRAISSEADIPYQALIKMMLSESVSRYSKNQS
jgi:hypothetical protein